MNFDELNKILISKASDKYDRFYNSDRWNYDKYFKILDDCVKNTTIYGSYLFDIVPEELFIAWGEKRLSEAKIKDWELARLGIRPGHVDFERAMLKATLCILDIRNIDGMTNIPLEPIPIRDYFEDTEFTEIEPQLQKEKLLEYPIEKSPKLSFKAHFSRKIRNEEINKSHNIFLAEQQSIVEKNNEIKERNRSRLHEYFEAMTEYKKKKAMFEQEIMDKYPSDEICFKSKKGIENYFIRLIDRIEITFPFFFDLEYNMEHKILIINVHLPNYDDDHAFGPLHKKIRFHNETIELLPHSNENINHIYKDLYKQFIIRVTNDLYVSDSHELLSGIFMNLYVTKEKEEDEDEYDTDDDEFTYEKIYIGKYYTKKNEFMDYGICEAKLKFIEQDQIFSKLGGRLCRDLEHPTNLKNLILSFENQ